jgi:hypothetical protein
MTIGQLIESLFGKACALYGAYGDCTAFSAKGSNYSTYGHMLTKQGYHHSGNELMYNGYSGEQIYSEIFIGPTYYMRLKHMVKDKINYRARGPNAALTRQPVQGRANDGGLRIGEMERDGIMANGLSYFLNESYLVRGDEYYMAVCNKTGTIAVYNPDKNLFLSPFVDGPLIFNKNTEGEEILDVFSKFGRSFSLLRIPYALKLLIQELQVMNVQMRIITSDNVDQLLNLSYQSRNIDKLLHIEDGIIEKDITLIIEEYSKSLNDKRKQVVTNINKQTSNIRAFNQELEKDVEPQFNDSSPELQFEQPQLAIPEYSPEYSPKYLPEQNQELKDLGEYTPDQNSPEYAPDLKIPQIVGGMANVFNNEIMNVYFNKLPGDKQATILQMGKEQRELVMKTIMEKSARQNNIEQQLQQGENHTHQGGNGLTDMFTRLPIKYQVDALGSQYKTIASAFNKLGGDIETPKITIAEQPDPIEGLREILKLPSNDTGNNNNNSSTKNAGISENNKIDESSSNSETRKINII